MAHGHSGGSCKYREICCKRRKGVYEEELIQVWIIHYIQIVGEAANQLSDSIKKNHLEIPWKGITGMRNVLVHQYFGFDLDEIWDTVSTDLPVLKVEIQELLAEHK